MKRKKKGKYDFSSLSIDQAGVGAEVCIRTAKRMIEGAQNLSKGGYSELATFLVCAAIEETGKAMLLLHFQEGKHSGKQSAIEDLEEGFGRHMDKLEIAWRYWKWDEKLFTRIKRLQPGLKTGREMADAFTRLTDGIKLPNLVPIAKQTFRKRNNMLYTEYERGKFVAPQQRVRRRTFNQLLAVAEQSNAKANLERVMSQIWFRRGLSRAQVATKLSPHLPEFFEEMLKKLQNIPYKVDTTKPAKP